MSNATSDVYERFIGLLSDFGVLTDEVEADHTFTELEFDSLALVELTLAVQQEFGVSIGDDELAPDDTIVRTAKVIEEKMVSV